MGSPSPLPLAEELAKIRFARFRFRLRVTTPMRLPPYKGSTLRGGFGIAFKESVCVVQHADCGRCILSTRCAYPYIFETPVPEGSRRMASLEYAPHPFVIEPPLDTRTRYDVGDALDFGLVLIGRGIEYLPYFVFAFQELGKRRGIGRAIDNDVSAHADAHETNGTRGRFTVESVAAITARDREVTVFADETLVGNLCTQTIRSSDAWWAASSDGTKPPRVRSCLGVRYLTPTRLVFERRLATIPEFHILLRNLLRRLSNVAYFHCEQHIDIDFLGLIQSAHAVRLADNRTCWHEWERYSARQDARLQMGGLVGIARYEGDLVPFVPLLALGEVLHIGKGTGLGLGRYAQTMPDA